MKQPSDFQCRQLLFEVGQEIGSCFLVLSLEAVDSQVRPLAQILKFWSFYMLKSRLPGRGRFGLLLITYAVFSARLMDFEGHLDGVVRLLG